MPKTVYVIKDRETGEVLNAVPQMVDLNFDGRYVLRYNIGIDGYTEWSFIHCIYDNDEFNKRYEVLWSRPSCRES